MSAPLPPGSPLGSPSLAGRVLSPVKPSGQPRSLWFPIRNPLRLAALLCATLLIAILAWANWPSQPPPNGARADRIVIWKSKRQLELYAQSKLLKTYSVSLGRNPVGPKTQEGDKRTPEGRYSIELHKQRSSFHRALKISYPSLSDREAAAKRGVSPGNDIMIHGLRNGLGLLGRFHRQLDWTSGCIAVTNPEIDEIYRTVPDGTPVEIHP